jgi:hypothetical protein
MQMQEKKKQRKRVSIMKQLLVLICGAMLFAAYAQAQTTTSSTTTSQASGSTTTSATDSSGTVTDYTPGAAIVIDPGTGEPVHFLIGKTIQVVTPDGKVIEAAKVRKNAKVHVHLVQEGDHTVVDKITVDDAQ